jgi:hypothetical protein
LTEQQPSNAVRVLDALLQENGTLSGQPSTVILLVGGRSHHAANSPLASCPSHQGPNQHLPIDPIGLGASVTAVHSDRRGIDNMAFDSVFDKQPVNPESVQASLLNNRDRDRRAG